MGSSQTQDSATGRAGLSDGQDRRWVAAARILIGLAQGAALYWLYHSMEGLDGLARAWPATEPLLFGPLLLVSAYLPVVLLAGVGRMRALTLLVWAAAAAAALALLGWHDVARQSAAAAGTPPFMDIPLFPFAATALFITHHLIAPADRERRLIAGFPTYFDAAWMAGVQLALSIGFTGAFWLLLQLGGALFGVIGLTFLNDLLREAWFNIPVTCVAFAVAVQLTDVRDGLIRGVRSVALMLLSWLLLVMTVLVAGFMAALPFTGLDGLWETGSATALVLAAAAALIILINTAYQDGQPDNLPPAVLRIAVRVASVLLTPLVLLAAWGLALRIGQHGLTPDRIVAIACTLVGAAYAAGYGFAALQPFWRKGDWMRPLERTNIVTAVLAVVVILALFTPLADPARLSVADQMRRLENGEVAPDRFDYAFLRFESGKAGEAALARLTRSDDPEIARLAREAGVAESVVDLRREVEPSITPVIGPWPVGEALPPAFLAAVTPDDPRAQCRKAGDCLAARMDMNGDAVPEVLLVRENGVDLYGAEGERWVHRGEFPLFTCRSGPLQSDPRAALRAGAIRPVESGWSDLTIGGAPSRFNPVQDCPRGPPADAARAAPAADEAPPR